MRKLKILSTLFCLLLFTLFTGCSEDDVPVGSDPVGNVPFGITSVSKSIVEPMDSIILTGVFDGFNDSSFALMADSIQLPVLAYTSSQIISIAPLHGHSLNQTLNVFIKSDSGLIQSDSLDISVSGLPQKYPIPGQLSKEIINSIQLLPTELISLVKMNVALLPNGIDSVTAINDLNKRFEPIGILLAESHLAVDLLSEEDKRILDGIFYATGLDSICNEISINISSMRSQSKQFKAQYADFYSVHAMDGFSAILTAATNIAGLTKTVTAILTPITGGSSALITGISMAVELGVGSIDNYVDGLFITDIDSIWIDLPLSPNNTAYISSTVPIKIYGRFTSQSNPKSASLNIFLDVSLSMLPDFAKKGPAAKKMIKEGAQWISTTLGKKGITSTFDFGEYDSKWKSSISRTIEIDPTIYEMGITGTVTTIGKAIHPDFQWPTQIQMVVDNHVSKTTTISNNISFNKITSNVTILNSGQATINLHPFSYKPGIIPFQKPSMNLFKNLGSVGLTLSSIITTYEIPTDLKGILPSFAINTDPIFDGSMSFSQLALNKHPNATLFTSFTNASGVSLTNLDLNDLILAEDGKQCTITSVEKASSTTNGAITTDYVLVLDNSKSMGSDNIIKVDNAVKYFSTVMPIESQVAIVRFGAQSQVLGNGTFKTTAADIGATLDTDPFTGDGNGTALWNTIIEAANMLKSSTNRRVVIAFTDGADDGDGNTLQSAIEKLRSAGVTCYTIGAGDQIATEDMTTLATGTGGHYYNVTNLDDIPLIPSGRTTSTLEEVFTEIVNKEKDLFLINYSSLTSLDDMPHTVSLSYKGKVVDQEFLFQSKPITDPEPVTIDTIIINTDTTITIKWTPSADPWFDRYEILRHNPYTGKIEVISRIYSPNSFQFIDNNLCAGDKWQYSLKIYNSQNTGISSPISHLITIVQEEPEIVSGISSTVESKTSVDLYWEPNGNNNFSYYRIVYDTIPELIFTDLNNERNSLTHYIPEQDCTTTQLTSLITGEKYYYQIYVVNSRDKVYSKSLIDSFYLAPLITLDLDATYDVNVGDTLMLYCESKGENKAITWYKNGEMIPNENNDTLSVIFNDHNQDGDQYNCVVSNDKGSDTSSVATMTVWNGILYVNKDFQDTTTLLTGSSWKRPLREIPNSSPNELITDLWITKGEYVFQNLSPFVNIFGGFEGQETFVQERLKSNRTIFNGLAANILWVDKLKRIDGISFIDFKSDVFKMQGTYRGLTYDNVSFHNSKLPFHNQNLFPDSTTVFSNTVFDNCDSLFIDISHSSIKFENSKITNSTVSLSDGYRVHMSTCTLTNNTAAMINHDDAMIRIKSADNVIFRNNNSDLSADSTTFLTEYFLAVVDSLTNCIIDSNKTAQTLYSYDKTIFDSCLIMDNISWGNCIDTRGDINNCQIVNNTSHNASIVYEASNLKQCFFYHNISGMSLVKDVGNVVNCAFWGNKSQYTIYGSNLIAHSTFNSNRVDNANTEKHYTIESAKVVENSIVWSSLYNVCNIDADELSNNIVKNPDSNTSNPLIGEIIYSNNIPVGIPLLEGSPAIDAALSTENSPSIDIMGTPRPKGINNDIGCYEF